jgi:tRNA dimethylallyltransferase
VEQILGRGKIPFIVGGTGLYIDTIYKNFTMPKSAPNYSLRKQREEQELAQP